MSRIALQLCAAGSNTSHFNSMLSSGCRRSKRDYDFLAPYRLRDCFRPSTPSVSSAPRTTWYRTPGRSRTRPPRTKHDRVFLQAVSFTWDINGDFFAVGKPHTSDLPQRRVGLLGRHGANLQADAPLLRAMVKHRRLALARACFFVVFERVD